MEGVRKAVDQFREGRRGPSTSPRTGASSLPIRAVGGKASTLRSPGRAVPRDEARAALPCSVPLQGEGGQGRGIDRAANGTPLVTGRPAAGSRPGPVLAGNEPAPD